MVKFKPIVYSDDDLRSFNFKDATSIQEGYVCKLATGGDANTTYCTKYTGGFKGTGTNVQTATILNYMATKNSLFCVYYNDPDVENVGATISTSDMVVSFPFKAGNEFEIHTSCTECGVASFAAIGGHVAVASTGKLTYKGSNNSTAYIVAETLATINSTWIRLRTI